MNLLIKNAIILQKGNKYHKQKQDILIVNGKIERIGDSIEIENKEIKTITGNELYCTVGLCDIGTHSGEPGFEHRESIHTLTSAALKGGFTALCIFPNTNPITQSKSSVRYLSEHPDRQGVKLFPIAALSQDLHGKNITEYIDLASAGAIAVSDGLISVQSTGLLDRAMMYSWNAGLPMILHPDDRDISHEGLMHEGKMSTSLGMRGVPDIAESQMIQRDVTMLSYNEHATIIEHGISSAKSVTLIGEAKKKAVNIGATVPYLNLLMNDHALLEFDSNLKVKPVIREETDRNSLIDGLKGEVIDAIVSNHVPLDTEAKALEFYYAKYGASGLETCLPALVDNLKDTLPLEVIVDKLTKGPRQLLNIDIPKIDEGSIAEICVFDINSTWHYTSENAHTKSLNNIYLNNNFKTKVVATIIGNHVALF